MKYKVIKYLTMLLLMHFLIQIVLSSVQNEKIAPILCANGHNECSPVFALKLAFIMILDLVFPFNVKHFGKVCYV